MCSLMRRAPGSVGDRCYFDIGLSERSDLRKIGRRSQLIQEEGRFDGRLNLRTQRESFRIELCNLNHKHSIYIAKFNTQESTA